MEGSAWNRRRVIRTAMHGIGAIACVRVGWAASRVETSAAASPATEAAPASDAAAPAKAADSRWLQLFNTHTRETVRVAFWEAGAFVEDALAELQYLLRDHRVGVQHPIDPQLYVLLSDLAAAAGREPRYQVISGYRSPATNERLCAQDRSGVSKRSLHMEGRAIDVRLEGVPCATLRDLAIALRRGGVGYYERSDFVHLDTGRFRTWQG